ncbi:MAG: U32 family peptidase, partial [Lentisphaerae bacterium]|nr:U32 family peptidase [Lentisphaerota bacterium]
MRPKTGKDEYTRNITNRLPELLAPAGSIEAGLAAFDHGADAVYAGLARHNARERGKNFSLQDFSKLAAYAHKQNKRIYLTLNTLIKDSELSEVAEMMAEVACIRPDAIIVQDPGVVAMAQRWFPELNVHASTQMGIHNSAGLKVAEMLGIKRVILERQVTLGELEQIIKNTNLEVEVFVHGALCCSRSGSCLFSSWIGGWSGNRGKCKQPCRRRYFSKDGNGFFFSPNDLCALDSVDDLCRIGVSSLKIEGRLRSEDYVAKVVAGYRQVLDSAPEDRRQVALEAFNSIRGVASRKLHGAFENLQSFDTIIRHDAMGVSGIPMGEVIGTGKNRITLKLSRDLYAHDRIRVQPTSGDEGPAFTVVEMRVDGKDETRALRGSVCEIVTHLPVETGAKVYKLGSQTTSPVKRIESLPLERLPLDFDICVSAEGLQIDVAI